MYCVKMYAMAPDLGLKTSVTGSTADIEWVAT
jgi:hypothetical protein